MLREIKKAYYLILSNYHVNKQFKINMKYRTIHNYHFEMAQHYYEKANGKEWEG